ncbi:MAG TPA: NAD(P)/FAD-dependent oxidoreductase [Anaerolineae bacterium]|nr:NAD(P)/FAD-dependent oxidoreductase [Anaerolineae bacterium]
MPQTNILIIGGGAAGLTAAGALKHVGLDSVILDKTARVGTTWATRYERLHLHTIRHFSGLAHYPIPREYGKYVAKDKFAEYLQSYANHFGLTWQGNSPVHKIRVERNRRNPKFTVEAERETWTSNIVIIATGHFGVPVLPQFPGVGDYKGLRVHSTQYKTGSDFAGKRVLVIGAGNSGAEIAADLAEQGAEFVALAIRSTPPIVPRDWLGMPAQVFGLLLTPLPPRLADRIAASIARVALGDLSRYGLKKANWLPFSAKRIPIIDVGLVKEIRAGRVVLRPNVARFTTNGVVFKDGRAEEFDIVVSATGFKTGLEELLDVPQVLNSLAEPKFPSGQTTSIPNLYFIGYVYSHRGHLLEANEASQRLAQVIVSR